MEDNLDELESMFDDMEEPVVEDLTAVHTMDLLERFEAITEELKNRGEAWLGVHTREARDMHSQRYALQYELRKRDMPV